MHFTTLLELDGPENPTHRPHQRSGTIRQAVALRALAMSTMPRPSSQNFEDDKAAEVSKGLEDDENQRKLTQDNILR